MRSMLDWENEWVIGWLVAWLGRRWILTERSSLGWVGETSQIDLPHHAGAIFVGGSGDGTTDGGGVSIGENSSVRDADGVVGDDFGITELACSLSENNGEEEGGGND